MRTIVRSNPAGNLAARRDRPKTLKRRENKLRESSTGQISLITQKDGDVQRCVKRLQERGS